MRLHPLHPAAWVLDQLRESGWTIHELLVFTRASTLVLAGRSETTPVVLKAGFGSNHVLNELDDQSRRAAYGFYWYAELTEAERALTRQDFRHEIDLTRTATGGEHVVPLLEQGSTDHFDWYSMPFCTGGNFRPFLTAAPGEQRSRGLGLLADVAEGLHTLHERGIVHRDVYQENILIHQGRGLITDLGAARHLNAPRGPLARGPEVHWPPEYTTSYNKATPAADVFSLAVLIYRFLCADLPRHGHSRLDTVPAGLRQPLAAALAANPKDRPSISELGAALQHAATRADQPKH